MPVRLQDLGRVIDSVQDTKLASWFNGQRSIVLAIQRQAATFVEEAFFTPLKGGEIDKAFYYTIEPDRRKGMLVSDIPKRFGDVFTPFQKERLQRLLVRGKDAATFESLDKNGERFSSIPVVSVCPNMLTIRAAPPTSVLHRSGRSERRG